MKAKEVLIFTRHVRKWEFAHEEVNRSTGKMQWERRDGSYICDVGLEVATLPVPAPPKNWKSFRKAS